MPKCSTADCQGEAVMQGGWCPDCQNKFAPAIPKTGHTWESRKAYIAKRIQEILKEKREKEKAEAMLRRELL